MEKTFATIQITPETKKRISIDNYTNISGTKNENILCALIVNLCASTNPITAKNFLTLYNWLVPTLHQGINIDLELHPLMQDSSLLKEALSLRGDVTENLINRESCLKIANFISNDDKNFAKDLKYWYNDFEMKLLLFSFFPGSL